jgi:hypothetical protein
MPSERCSARPAFDKRLSTVGQRLQRGRLLQQRFFGLTTFVRATNPAR